jgi:hypothetical protein
MVVVNLPGQTHIYETYGVRQAGFHITWAAEGTSQQGVAIRHRDSFRAVPPLTTSGIAAESGIVHQLEVEGGGGSGTKGHGAQPWGTGAGQIAGQRLPRQK